MPAFAPMYSPLLFSFVENFWCKEMGDVVGFAMGLVVEVHLVATAATALSA